MENLALVSMLAWSNHRLPDYFPNKSDEHGYFYRALYCKTVPVHLYSLYFVKGFRCHVTFTACRTRNYRNVLYDQQVSLFTKAPCYKLYRTPLFSTYITFHISSPLLKA